MCVKNDKCRYVTVNTSIPKNSAAVYSSFMIKYELYFKLKRAYPRGV